MNPIIRQIIDRDCHVADSYVSVVKHVVSRLKDGRNTFFSLDKQSRREFIDDCFKCHTDNRELYSMVMGDKLFGVSE